MAFSKAPEESSAPTIEPRAPRKAFDQSKLSEEQLEIINCDAPLVVGQAFAGTGKSTTGIGYATKFQDKKILVLCFNRANAIEAAEKYAHLKNASVGTTHALAYTSGILSNHQKARVAHRWNALTLRSELPIVGGKGDMRTAAITASILNEFFMTPDTKIDPAIHGKYARNVLNAAESAIDQAVPYASRLWTAMQSSDSGILIPHDAYLKMFVMRSVNLDYDTVIFDEAQDANPIMLKLLEDQYTQKNSRGNNSKVIYLGDRHQAIYEFRGAVNAMENLPDSAKILPLTQSWRFGPYTASLANCILQELKQEELEIKGMGEDRPYKSGDQVAYISRTNSDLFARAVAVRGEGIHWVGGIEGYRIQMLQDALHLYTNKPNLMTEPHIKKNFRSYVDLEQAAKYDTDANILVTLVKEYGDSIPEIVDEIKKNAVPDQSQASLVLTTAHKSKGLEWDHIQLANDYRNVFKTAEDNLAGKAVAFPEQEVNLMYVATTRAKCSVDINYEMDQWHKFLDHHRAKRVRDFAAGVDTAAPEARFSSKRGKNGAFGKILKPFNARIR